MTWNGRGGRISRGSTMWPSQVQPPPPPPPPPPPTGGAYASNDAVYDAAYIFANPKLGAPPAGAMWVATNGNDTTGNGSQGNPYATIQRAIQAITAGGTVIVKDGTYTGESQWISSRRVTIPSGSAGNWTTIRAENRFGVRINYPSPATLYGDAPINLGNTTSYIWVDGFIVNATYTASTGDGNDTVNFQDEGVRNRITRWASRKVSCDAYGGHLSTGTRDSYSVIADGFMFGSIRYGLQMGSGGLDLQVGKAVVQRCVAYSPFGPVAQPTGTYSIYGSNNGAWTLARDVLWANCYEIDSPNLPTQTNPDGYKWASFIHPKSVRNIRHIGCGVINGGAEVAGYRTSSVSTSSDQFASYRDCFVAGFGNGSNAVATGFSVGSGTIDITNCTVSGVPGGAFPSSGAWTGSANLTSGINNPVTRVAGNGAEQRYAVGFLKEYDEAGYDVIDASLKLWPWPYESIASSLFGETITRVPQDQPVGTSQSTNPFAGTSIGGQPQTFTRRVWESMGVQIPDLSTVY